MKHSRAPRRKRQIQRTHTSSQPRGYRTIEAALRVRAGHREYNAQRIELCALGHHPREEERDWARERRVQEDVCPGADGVGRRVFPGLQAVRVREVVGGLPEVEDFVAVGDCRVARGEQAREEEEGECGGGGYEGAAGGVLVVGLTLGKEVGGTCVGAWAAFFERRGFVGIAGGPAGGGGGGGAGVVAGRGRARSSDIVGCVFACGYCAVEKRVWVGFLCGTSQRPRRASGMWHARARENSANTAFD